MVFQLTLPCEERSRAAPPMILSRRFNSRSLARSDSHRLCYCSPALVSTHAPLRGAMICGRHMPRRMCCFNSRSLARSDRYLMAYKALYKVSTHAPLRGAIREKDAVVAHALVSTHAPLRGAIYFYMDPHDPNYGFNSRSLARSDANKISDYS